MQKILICLVLLMFFLVSCGPVSLPPTVTLTTFPWPENTPDTATVPAPSTTPAVEPTAGPVFSTLSPPNVQEAHLEEIQMMDETSGWGWAVDGAYEIYLLHSSDGGLTWEDVTPDQDLFFGSYSSFLLDAQTAWIVLADESLARTSDGGQTWDVINQNLMDELVWPFRDWYRLRFADAQHGWLVAGYTAAGAHEIFYETRDGGLTWDPADFQTLPDSYRQSNARNELAFWTETDVIYYDLERFILVPGEQEGTLEMFLSTDWGDSWKTVQLPSSAFSGLSFEPNDRKINSPVFFDRQNGVLVVTIRDRSANVWKVFVYGTSDGGLTWTLSSGPSIVKDVRSEISFLSPHEAVFVCGTSFCVTHDSGNSWLALDSGIPIPTDTTHMFIWLDFINPTIGWLLLRTTNDQGVWLSSRLLKTTDGGATWMELSPVINP